MIGFQKLTEALVLENLPVLTGFYYSNSVSCSAAYDSSRKQAENKIRELARYLSEGKAVSYAAFAEGAIVGYVWAYEYRFRDEDRMYVSEIHVLQEYRGNRIGHTLLSLVEKEAKERGLPSIYIHTEAENKGAWRLYEREGFVLERVQLCKRIDRISGE